jgi:predicted nucleic-acid-binding Zn-ribbon protein
VTDDSYVCSKCSGTESLKGEIRADWRIEDEHWWKKSRVAAVTCKRCGFTELFLRE